MGKRTQPGRGELMPWRTLAATEMFSVPGRFSVTVETVELPDGRVVDDYWQIAGAQYVVVFAETEDGRIVCLRQYRHGPRRVGLELVAGNIDRGETPLAAAQRELAEESGYVSADWQPLGDYVVSGSQGVGWVHFFRARNAVREREPASGDLEETVILLLSRDALLTEMRNGGFTVADHLAGVSLGLLT